MSSLLIMQQIKPVYQLTVTMLKARTVFRLIFPRFLAKNTIAFGILKLNKHNILCPLICQYQITAKITK